MCNFLHGFSLLPSIYLLVWFSIDVYIYDQTKLIFAQAIDTSHKKL